MAGRPKAYPPTYREQIIATAAAARYFFLSATVTESNAARYASITLRWTVTITSLALRPENFTVRLSRLVLRNASGMRAPNVSTGEQTPPPWQLWGSREAPVSLNGRVGADARVKSRHSTTEYVFT